MTEAIDTARSGGYAGNGSTTSFAYTFTIGEATDLVVVLVTDATGAEVVQTLTTHYTVNGAGDAGGGTIDMVTAPASGETLWIRRATDLENEVDLQNRGAVVPAALEAQFDKITRGMQDLDERLERAVSLKIGAGITGLEMPFVSQSGALFWDGTSLTTAQLGDASTITLPGSVTDNSIPRFDGTDGTALQATSVTISDAGQMIVPGQLGVLGGLSVIGGDLTVSSGANLSATGLIYTTGAIHTPMIRSDLVNPALKITDPGTAVNYPDLTPGASGNDPDLEMEGSDTDIGLSLTMKGAGYLTVVDDGTAIRNAFRANTSYAALTSSGVWSAAAEVTLTDQATIALDLSTGFNFTVTLAGNRALDTPSNAKVGQSGYIRVVQDATGSRTLSYATEYEFAGGSAPTLSTGAAAEDLLYYVVLASNRVAITSVLDIG